MAAFRRARIEELCELVTDGTHDSPKLQKEGVPFIKGKNISSSRVDFAKCDFITQEDHKEACRRVKPQRGDILFSNIGSVGDTAVVNDDREFSIKNVALFRPDRRKVDQGYFYYLVLSPEFRSNVMNVRSGSAQPFISLANLRSLEVSYVEDAGEQRRIAGILSAYDELMENSQRRIKILEAMARALYREWFVHFRFPGHEKNPLVDSPLGKIPKGWEVKKLSELVSTQYGYTESTNESPVGPKYLRGMDMNKTSYIDWSQVPYCPISAEDKEFYAVKKGDVFVIRMADPGKVGIAEHDVDAVFASYLIRVRPADERLHPYFLFHLLDSPSYQSFISGAATGTTRKSASAGVITDFQFALPPKELVAEFEVRATTIREMLTTLLQQIQNLRRTRDLLLPRLLSGQVELASQTSN